MRSIKSLFLLTLAFGVITLNSCKKDKDTTETKSATVSASVDGTATNFNTNALAAQASVNGSTITTIQGTAANKSIISIAIYGTITAGKTYSNNASDDLDKPIMGFEAGDDQYYNDDNSTTNIVSITITSVTSSTVAGTFKGDLTTFSVGNDAPKTKSITNGKFNVVIVK